MERDTASIRPHTHGQMDPTLPHMQPTCRHTCSSTARATLSVTPLPLLRQKGVGELVDQPPAPLQMGGGLVEVVTAEGLHSRHHLGQVAPGHVGHQVVLNVVVEVPHPTGDDGVKGRHQCPHHEASWLLAVGAVEAVAQRHSVVVLGGLRLLLDESLIHFLPELVDVDGVEAEVVEGGGDAHENHSHLLGQQEPHGVVEGDVEA
mmetsp:Transcript_28704/g.82849  ORF Transcript_28704/g.82849 Transcript_28704/m.82849 type:complete len:204 (+) Transcript_28704:78-689(+)